jgi:hypothetical protein
MDKELIKTIAEMVDGAGFTICGISKEHEADYEPITLVIRKRPPEELADRKGAVDPSIGN